MKNYPEQDPDWVWVLIAVIVLVTLMCAIQVYISMQNEVSENGSTAETQGRVIQVITR